MSEQFDLILRGGSVATPNGIESADVAVKGGKIAAIGDLSGADAQSVMDVNGLHVLPGVIDPQVHLREPGLEHKEDLATGTTAAVLGGVTACLEMPNTSPGTTTPQALADKCRRAKGRARCDISFFVGAALDNLENLGELENLPGSAGIKVFVGSSTGNLLVEDDASLALIMATGNRRICFHCEDEERLKERFSMVEGGAPVHMHAEWRDAETALLATKRILRLAKGVKRRVHILHVTTAGEMEVLKDHHDFATVEVTPQHLTLWGPDAYERIGSRAQMNPPIRSKEHVDALWESAKRRSGGLHRFRPCAAHA